VVAGDRQTESTQLGVDWLARDIAFVEGLDHLGIQIVSTNIYSRLVPGISNLTDRARYFSFYSWVLDSFARHASDKSADGWRTWIRRHEFALSAACVAAEQETIDDDAAGGLVGAIAARKLTKGKRVDIDGATRLEGGKAGKGTYFKNREGGYSQYYKGPMTALGLLRIDEGRKAPDRLLTAYAGAPLAREVEGIQAFRALRGIAESGSDVSVDELAKLGRVVHPASMDPDGREATLLRGMLLGDDDDLCAGQLPIEKEQRRRSLALVLNYVAQGDQDDWLSPVWGFRWSVLDQQLGDGRAWKIPSALRESAVAWAAYAQSELLSFALESLLLAILRVLDGQPLSPRALAARIAGWACEATRADAPRGVRRALPAKVVHAVSAHAPPARDECWEVDGTFALQEELADAEEPHQHAARAARVLLRVAADRTRYGTRHPFATVPQGAEIASAREIHLQAWWDRIDAASDQDTRSFFEELVLEWVIYRHLRVATRKLATQGDYTYRLRPEEGVLVACGDFQPGFTNPRLRQALRIMADIGLATSDLRSIGAHGERLLRRIA
jgi:hypothetical protein